MMNEQEKEINDVSADKKPDDDLYRDVWNRMVNDPSVAKTREEEIKLFEEELKKHRVEAKIEDDTRFREKLIQWMDDLYNDLCTDAECDLYRMWVDQCDADLKLDDKYAKYQADKECTARVDEMKAKIGTRLDRVADLVLTHDDYDTECPAVMNIISQVYKRISDMDIQEQKDLEVIRRKLKDLYQAVIFSDEVKEEERKKEQEKIVKAGAKIDKDRFRDRLVHWAEELYEGLCTDAECVMYEAFLDQEDSNDEKDSKDESSDDDNGECVRYEKYLSEEGRQAQIDTTKKEIEKCLNYVINLILSDHKSDSTLSTIASALLSAIKKRMNNLASDLPNPTSENPTPYVEWERLTQKMVKDLYHAVQFSVDCKKVHVAEKAVASAAAAFAEGTDGGDDDDDDNDEGIVITGEMYLEIYNKGLMPFQDEPPEIPLVLEKDEEIEEGPDDDDKKGGKWIDSEVFSRLSDKGMLPFQDGPLATEAAAAARADKDDQEKETSGAAAARADKDDQEKETSGGHIMDKYVCLWDKTPGLTYTQWAQKQFEEQKRAEAIAMLDIDME